MKKLIVLLGIAVLIFQNSCKDSGIENQTSKIFLKILEPQEFNFEFKNHFKNKSELKKIKNKICI